MPPRESYSRRDEHAGAGLGLVHVVLGVLILALDHDWGIYVLCLGLAFWAEGLYRLWRRRQSR